jgi:AcrR family transcriptional regulator
MTAEPGVDVKRPVRQRAAPRRSRSSESSREKILKAATVEFCAHGFNGARVERIAKRSGANMRMLYHYFDSKEGLYLAALDKVYTEIRSEERKLKLDTLDPVQGMRQLVAFTFDFFASHMDFIGLINNENLMKGRFIKRSPKIRAMTIPLVETIRDLLERGAKTGVMRTGVDPIQLYISIVAQSQLHISSRYTLSAIFDRDLGDEAWLAERRRHAQDVILGYLTNLGSW